MGSMDNNWVNTILVGGEAMMLTDATAMLRMDLDTLEFHGFKAWYDKLMGMGSAHPV